MLNTEGVELQMVDAFPSERLDREDPKRQD